MKDEPAAEEYVVGLGKARNLTYLCARVVHTQETVHRGQTRYRVGCRFTGRAGLDRSTLRLFKLSDGDSATGEAMQDEQQEEAEVQPLAARDESKSQEAREGNTTVARQTA